MRVKRIVVVGSALAILAAVGLPVLSLLRASQKAKVELERQLQLARAEGLPTTFAEYAATIPTARPEENAAPFYRKLHGIADLKPDGADVDRHVTYHPSPKDLADAEALLRSRARYMAALDQAVTKPKCWFDRDWSLGAATLLPEYHDMKCAGRLIALRGSVAAARGDTKAAIADGERLRRMANHCRIEGPAIGQLTGLSLNRIAMSHLASWSFVHRDQPSYAEALKRTADQLTKLDLHAIYLSDLSDLLSLVDLSSTEKGREVLGLKESEIPVAARVVPIFFDRNDARARIVADERAIWAAVDLPKKQRIEAISAAREDLWHAEMAFPIAYSVDYDFGGLGDDLRPHLDEIWEAYRQQYVALNRALSRPIIPTQIRTDDLLSPFDGKPIQYSFDGKQIVIHISGHMNGEKPVYLKVPSDASVK